MFTSLDHKILDRTWDFSTLPTAPVTFSTSSDILTAHNCQKLKSRFFTCPYHKIYMVEAVGLSISTFRITIFVCKIWGYFVKFDIFSITA